MTLSWVEWQNDPRVQRAENNNPAMKPGESGRPVHLLQAALILHGFDVPHHGITGDPPRQNNNYLGETQNAVRQCEARFGLTQDIGIAGQQVIQRLDQESNTFYTVRAGRFGAALARTDVTRAIGKISSALLGLTFLRNGALPATVAPLVDAALRTHFRLLPPGSAAAGPQRARTNADLDHIITTFTDLAGVLNAGATSFQDGIPETGVKNPAESVPGSRVIRFGPFFRDFDAPFLRQLGPETRAAILIHEGTHAVDRFNGRSGAPGVHISEFDGAYNVQPADLSLHNPSSYASFAAHIANNGDPAPRFGLGGTDADRAR